MKLDGTVVKSTNKKSQLSASDENELSQFVINNREAIKALSDMLIEIEDFKKIMIPGGETATDEQRMNMLNNLQIAIQEQDT
jgi:putative intracellular protease/amidase